MFGKLLKTAMDAGTEVIVETKYYGDGVKGRVLDFDGTHFTVFHNGSGGGMLWAFRLEDVACCGLVVELPTSLSSLPDIDTGLSDDDAAGSSQHCAHR
jgi:hypothetical protein